MAYGTILLPGIEKHKWDSSDSRQFSVEEPCESETFLANLVNIKKRYPYRSTRQK